MMDLRSNCVQNAPQDGSGGIDKPLKWLVGVAGFEPVPLYPERWGNTTLGYGRFYTNPDIVTRGRRTQKIRPELLTH